MYVCMYLCIYVSMYLCIYASKYLCIYVSMNLCIYVGPAGPGGVTPPQSPRPNARMTGRPQVKTDAGMPTVNLGFCCWCCIHMSQTLVTWLTPYMRHVRGQKTAYKKNLHVLLYVHEKTYQATVNVIMMDELYLLDETELHSKTPRNYGCICSPKPSRTTHRLLLSGQSNKTHPLKQIPYIRPWERNSPGEIRWMDGIAIRWALASGSQTFILRNVLRNLARICSPKPLPHDSPLAFIMFKARTHIHKNKPPRLPIRSWERNSTIYLFLYPSTHLSIIYMDFPCPSLFRLSPGQVSLTTGGNPLRGIH